VSATAAYSSTVKITGTSTAFSNEACTDLGDDTNFQITDTAKRVWDPTVALVVEVDDGGGYAVIPATDYTVDPLFGIVTFNTPLGAGDVVRVDGSYLPLLTVASAKSATIACTRDMLDGTTFDSAGQREKVPGLAMASGSLAGLWLATEDLDSGGGTRSLFAVLTEGTRVVLEINPAAVLAFRAFVHFPDLSESASADGLIEGTLAWESTADTAEVIGTPTNGNMSFAFSDM
jgi:hypothetical protein